MNFKNFKNDFKENFESLVSNNILALYEAAVDKEILWEKYIESFSSENNKIFRERREHDCSCCKNFIRNFGATVILTADNKIKTIWDFKTDSIYQPSVDAMKKYIESCAIEGIRVDRNKKVGTDSNIELLPNGSTTKWEHLYIELPEAFISHKNDTDESIKAEVRTSKEVLKSSLELITLEALNELIELIKQGSIYKGDEWIDRLIFFKSIKEEFDKISDESEKEVFCWNKSKTLNPTICRIKNTSIGTLLLDLSEGKDLNSAITAYEKITAPSNYQRKKAVYSKRDLENAQKKIEELGLMDSLPRRFARLDDISINNVLFANRDAQQRMKAKNIFEEMGAGSTVIDPKKFSKIEEISIEDFIQNVLPTAKSIEALFENRLSKNMVSLITGQNEDAKSMFKWNNPFTWSYTGNITDSDIKNNVEKAGGNVNGILRFSIQWNDENKDESDLDAHCIEPSGYKIYFCNVRQLSPTGGMLDVDNRRPKDGIPGVENITWKNTSKMKDGEYKFLVHNFANRNNKGFKAEIEIDGQIHSFKYDSAIPNKAYIEVATVEFNKGVLKIKEKMKSTITSKKVWNIDTNQFVPVSTILMSPNFWADEKGIGNKHYLFMLKDCVNPEQPNGFYNEFLSPELSEHKRVLEALGSKMSVESIDDQLSGIGFSSTLRNELTVKVVGNTERILKIKF